jgi:hypothetical protein
VFDSTTNPFFSLSSFFLQAFHQLSRKYHPDKIKSSNLSEKEKEEAKAKWLEISKGTSQTPPIQFEWKIAFFSSQIAKHASPLVSHRSLRSFE